MFITDGAPQEPHPERMVRGTWWRSYILLFVGFSLVSLAAYVAFYRSLDEPLDVRTRATSDNMNAPVIAVIGVTDWTRLDTDTVTITGVAYDADGIRLVGIEIDGTIVLECADTQHCRYEWDTRELPPGNHTIRVFAKDASAQEHESSTTIHSFK